MTKGEGEQTMVVVPTRFWQRPVGRHLVGGSVAGDICFEGGGILQTIVKAARLDKFTEIGVQK